jgi:hypothetical protein
MSRNAARATRTLVDTVSALAMIVTIGLLGTLIAFLGIAVVATFLTVAAGLLVAGDQTYDSDLALATLLTIASLVGVVLIGAGLFSFSRATRPVRRWSAADRIAGGRPGREAMQPSYLEREQSMEVARGIAMFSLALVVLGVILLLGSPAIGGAGGLGTTESPAPSASAPVTPSAPPGEGPTPGPTGR